MALIRLWHAADEWLELAPNILLPTCTEGLALAQSRLTAHYMASSYTVLHRALQPWSQGPLSLLSGSSSLILSPAQCKLNTQTGCTNGTAICTILLKCDTAPSPATAQAATTKEVPVAREATNPVGSPKIRDIFVRPGQFHELSPYLLLTGNHPHPPPPLALLHHTITIPPLCPALIQMHTLVLQAHSHHTRLFHIAHTALSHL